MCSYIYKAQTREHVDKKGRERKKNVNKMLKVMWYKAIYLQRQQIKDKQTFAQKANNKKQFTDIQKFHMLSKYVNTITVKVILRVITFLIACV